MKTITLLVIALCINGVFGDKVKSMSVYEGDSLTLHTELTELQKDYVIIWRFGDQNDLIAKLNRQANTIRVYADVLNGRFRDRLKLDDQTGDLIITNITTQHSGNYKLEINGEKITAKTMFSVRVSVGTGKPTTLEDSAIQNNNVTNVKVNGEDQSSGSSSGVIAGLCVFLLVLVVALVVAVFLYKRLSRTTGNNWEDTTINEEETGKESAEMNKPLRTESPNNSDVP